MGAAIRGPSGLIDLGAEPLTIGRSRTNRLVLTNSQISSKHAEIQPLGGGRWQVVDVGSTNGTAVNGVKLSARSPQPLNAGDTITLGGTGGVELRFELTEDAPWQANQPQMAGMPGGFGVSDAGAAPAQPFAGGISQPAPGAAGFPPPPGAFGPPPGQPGQVMPSFPQPQDAMAAPPAGFPSPNPFGPPGSQPAAGPNFPPPGDPGAAPGPNFPPPGGPPFGPPGGPPQAPGFPPPGAPPFGAPGGQPMAGPGYPPPGTPQFGPPGGSAGGYPPGAMPVQKRGRRTLFLLLGSILLLVLIVVAIVVGLVILPKKNAPAPTPTPTPKGTSAQVREAPAPPEAAVVFVSYVDEQQAREHIVIRVDGAGVV